MQFKVPQDVQRADRIVGPLTLRHMIILGIGGGLAYVIYVILARTYFWEVWLPPVAVIVVITILIAFIKIYNMSFGKFFLLFIEYSILPRQRKWLKGTAEVYGIGVVPKKSTKKQKEAIEKSKKYQETIQKLDKISNILDKYGNEIKETHFKSRKKV